MNARRVDGRSGERWLLRASLICFFFAGLCALAIIFSGCAAAVVSAGVADVASTHVSIRSGAGREGNPAMGASLVKQSVLKAAGISSVLAGAHLLNMKGHPIWARVAQGIVIGFWSAATVNNVIVWRQ